MMMLVGNVSRRRVPDSRDWENQDCSWMGNISDVGPSSDKYFL